MATIDNPQVVKFINEVLRPLNDQFAGLFYNALRAKAQFAAQGLGDLIPTTTDLINDGSGSDGRPTMTGFFAHMEMAQVEAFLSIAQAPGNSGEPSLIDNVNSISVNPRY